MPPEVTEVHRASGSNVYVTGESAVPEPQLHAVTLCGYVLARYAVASRHPLTGAYLLDSLTGVPVVLVK
jgi:hypothetical protein